MQTLLKSLPAVLTVLALSAPLTGCDAMPREQYIQWVARDTWSSACAETAMVEIWKVENKRWKIQGEVMQIDVDATFKLSNDCDGMQAYESKRFEKKGLEVSRCKTPSGKVGWAIPGQESKRCWTGPRLVEG